MRRFGFATLALLPLLTVNAAFAHAFLNGAEPRVGSTVSSAPPEIRLSFTESVEATLSSIALRGAQGEVELGEAKTSADDRATLYARVRGKMAPGTYHVFWQVVSIDTHKTQGDFTFEYRP